MFDSLSERRTATQHNDEVLGGLGLTGDVIDALRRDRVIGKRPMS